MPSDPLFDPHLRRGQWALYKDGTLALPWSQAWAEQYIRRQRGAYALAVWRAVARRNRRPNRDLLGFMKMSDEVLCSLGDRLGVRRPR